MNELEKHDWKGLSEALSKARNRDAYGNLGYQYRYCGSPDCEFAIDESDSSTVQVRDWEYGGRKSLGGIHVRIMSRVSDREFQEACG